MKKMSNFNYFINIFIMQEEIGGETNFNNYSAGSVLNPGNIDSNTNKPKEVAKPFAKIEAKVFKNQE